MTAEVIKRSGFSMQVCVPMDWTDEAVKAFADRESICGTENGWFLRQDGDEALKGDPARNPCSQRPGHVHMVLDA